MTQKVRLKKTICNKEKCKKNSVTIYLQLKILVGTKTRGSRAATIASAATSVGKGKGNSFSIHLKM